MTIVLESAALDAIRWALDVRLADGVLVTPRALDTDAFGLEPLAQVQAISRTTASPIVVTVAAVSEDELHRAGREFGKVADHVVVALPFVDDGIAAMRRLATEGLPVAATFIVTPMQALLAARAGATYACMITDQLEASGHDPLQALTDARAMFDLHGVECTLLAVGTDSSRAATAALVAGADAVAVTERALREMLHHPLTDRAVDQMLGELSRRPRRRKR